MRILSRLLTINRIILLTVIYIIMFLFFIGFQPPESLYILLLVPIALSGRWGVRGGLISGAVAVALSALAGNINHGVLMTEETAPYAVTTWLFFVFAGVVAGTLTPHFRLYRRRATEAEERLSDENACLAEIGRIVTSSLDIDEIYERFAEQVRLIIPFDRVSITLLDESNENFEIAYLLGIGVPGRQRGEIRPLVGSITERILQTGSSLLFQVKDVRELTDVFPSHMSVFEAGLRSFLAAPLVSKDKIIGALHIRTSTLNAYNERDVALAERVAAQIAGAVANAQLYDSVKQAEEAEHRAAHENAVMAEIGRVISLSLDIDEVYERFEEQAHKLIDFERIAVAVADFDEGVIAQTYARQAENLQYMPNRSRPYARSVMEMTINAHKGIILTPESVEQARRQTPLFAPNWMSQIQSLISVPLFYNDRAFGSLTLSTTRPDVYSEHDVTLVERIAAQIAGAIANAQLYDSVKQAEEAEHRAAHENAVMAEIGRIISLSLDIGEVYERFEEQAHKLVDFDRAVVAVADFDEGVIALSYVRQNENLHDMLVRIRPYPHSIMEAVINARKGIILNPERVEQIRQSTPSFAFNWMPEVQSLIAVPLFYNDRAIGCLTFSTTRPDAYSEHDVALSERIAAQIAGAIANAQLYDSVKQAEEAEHRASHENAVMAEIGRIISLSLDIDEVYERFEEQTHKLINFDRITVAVADFDKGVIAQFYVRQNKDLRYVPRQTRPYAHSVMEATINARKGIILTPESVEQMRQQTPSFAPNWLPEIQSLISAPLFYNDRAFGCLTLSTTRPDAYSEHDVALAERIADQVAGAVENAQLYIEVKQAEESERRLAKENACLAEIGRIVTSSLDIDEVYERFAEHVGILIPFDRLAITLIDEEQENSQRTYFQGSEIAGERNQNERPLKGTFTGRVVESRSSVLFQTDEEDELLRAFPFNLNFFKAGLRSFMAVPLISRDRIIGALHLRSTTVNAYTTEDVALAERVAAQIAGAIANAQLLAKSRETEEALRKSEQRFAMILDIADDAIISMDEKQVITLFNQGAEKVFGYSADEIIGKPMSFLLPSDIAEAHHTYVRDFESGSEISRTMNDRGEVFGQRKDGTEFPAEASISKLDLGEGKKAFTVILRDITARKQAEAVIQESEERFLQLVENIPLVFWLSDVKPKGAFYVSPAYEKLYPATVKEIYENPLSWLEHVHPEDRDRVRHSIDTSQGAEMRVEFRIMLPDGAVRWVLNVHNSIRNEAGEVYRIVGFAEDITERKLAEEALQESQSRFLQVAENIPEALWLSDFETGLLYISPAYEKLYGTSPESLYEALKTWIDVIHPEDRERVRDIRKNHAKEEQYYEFRIVHPDGSTRWISNQLTPIKNEKGEVYRMVGVAQDITKRKLMEEQLIQSQKMEVVGQLAGGIAHDFNNLLTAILAYSHLGMMKLPSRDPVFGYMEEIKKAGERASKLTSQLLAFSRRQISEPRVLNLNEITLDTNKMLRRLIGENVELVVLPTDGLWLTEVDPGQIEQVLVNLAVNARDAMPDGGKLTIETANATIDEGFATLHAGLSEGEYVTLSVSDTGIGIPEDILEHIFEPFFTTKEVGKGTGLGLAMCYGIVTQSDGCIVVDSELGKGTTFTIYLPKSDVPATSMPLRDESGYLPSGSETVLLVEDEPALRNVAAHVLREQGYTVIEASNGTDALRVAEECSDQVIHLLLTDVVMPLMGGKELAEKLKLSRPDMSVLFASGYTDDAIVSRDILDNGTQFLQKPFTPADLARKVRETIQIR